mgnify:CR=1 FL=1
MNYFMNASCLVVHLFHSAVTELLLEARDYIQGHADAYDCSNEKQNHHDPNCATLTNGLGHAANNEGRNTDAKPMKVYTYQRYDHEGPGTSSDEV